MNVHRRVHLAKDWPRTIESAVGKLLVMLTEEQKDELRELSADDRWMLHHGFGTSIRNHFGLWRGNEPLLEACGKEHPDDASAVIIDELLKKLKEENGD